MSSGGRARRRANRPGPFDYARKTSLRIIFGVTALFLFLPLIYMMVYSFNDSNRLSNMEWLGFTTRHYHDLLDCSVRLDGFLIMVDCVRSELRDALLNSLTIAVISTVLSLILGALAAVVLWRFRFRFKPFYEGLVSLPIVIPEICLGVALSAFFWSTNAWVSPDATFPFNLTNIIIGHVTFSFPFAALVIRARLAGFNREMEEAAKDLGASEFQVFRDILLPYMTPGLVAAALLCFALSLDDFVITFFTSAPGATTFPIQVASQAGRRGLTPELAAASTILIVVTILVTVIAMRLHNLKDTVGEPPK